jgi:hypothetical protein
VITRRSKLTGRLLLLLVLIGHSGPAWASPTAATWRREILLGTNAEHYFVWVAEWGQPGSYFGASASVMMEKRRLWDSEVVEDTLVYSMRYLDEGADGSWDTTATAQELLTWQLTSP